MKKIKMLVAAAIAMFAVHASFAGAQDFILVNATEHNILSVYVSPSSHTSWEQDLLRGYLTSFGISRLCIATASQTLYSQEFLSLKSTRLCCATTPPVALPLPGTSYKNK